MVCVAHTAIAGGGFVLIVAIIMVATCMICVATGIHALGDV